MCDKIYKKIYKKMCEKVRERCLFITFEGVDGCGKSTQALRLKKWLEGAGFDVIYTFEPGGWSGGEKIRQMLLNGEVVDNITRLILFLGDRKFHVSEVIEPALKAGKIVICDRYADSTVAYQSEALGYEFVKKSVALYDFLRPDITFLLQNADINAVAERIYKRNIENDTKSDFIESGGVEFLEKINKIYDKIRIEEDELKINRIVLINADEGEDAIELKIRSELAGFIKKIKNIKNNKNNINEVISA